MRLRLYRVEDMFQEYVAAVGKRRKNDFVIFILPLAKYFTIPDEDRRTTPCPLSNIKTLYNRSHS